MEGGEEPNLLVVVRAWVRERFWGPDRNIRIILILAVFSSFTVTVLVDLGLQDWSNKSFASKTVVSVLTSLLNIVSVGLSFAVLDRLGLIRPIERRVTTLLDEVAESHRGMKKQLEILDSIRAQLFNEAKDYSDFESSRHVFGLAGISGVSPRPRESRSLLNTVLVKELQRARATTTVYCMNTFLEHSEAVGDVIRDAVRDGAKVKFLLLNPHDVSAARDRFDDAYEHDRFYYDDFEDFLDSLQKRSRQFRHIREAANALAHDAHSEGRMDVVFYTGSTNYPIVAVAEDYVDEQQQVQRKLVRTYTGYYGGHSSERMPYIEWQSAQHPFHEQLMTIFFRKWDRFKDITDPVVPPVHKR